MATFGCSPRAHWFMGMTDSERMRLIQCAPNTRTTTEAKMVMPGAPLPERGLSDADVDRIARRVAEILREAKP